MTLKFDYPSDRSGLKPSTHDYTNKLNESYSPFLDETKYHQSTVKTHNAHLKKLKKLDIDPFSLTDDSILDKVMQIKNSGASDKILSDQYVSGIYATIKRLQPALRKKSRELGLQVKPTVNASNRKEKIFNGTKKLLLDVVKDVKQLDISKSCNLESRRLIDTKIAIILTLLTNLRSSELLQLQIKHIDMIDRELCLSIRTKHRSTSIKVLKMAKLFSSLYPQIIRMALYRENLYANMPDSELKVILKHDNVIRNIRLLSCKIDTINKVLRELYVKVNDEKPSDSLGLKSIRTLNTTIIIEHNELLLAQTLNRHRDLNVTLRHYNYSSFEEKIANAY